VVLGRLTRIPAMVKVGGRRGAEGGADINLAERFAAGRRQAEAQQLLRGSSTPPMPAGASVGGASNRDDPSRPPPRSPAPARKQVELL
jgi:hypothetical protein